LNKTKVIGFSEQWDDFYSVNL